MDTGNIGHTRHRPNTTKKHNTENKNYEQHRPHEKTGDEEKQLLSVLLVANGYQNEIMKK